MLEESKEKFPRGINRRFTFKLLILNANERNHSLNLYMKNGIKYIKDERFLYFNEKIILENKNLH